MVDCVPAQEDDTETLTSSRRHLMDGRHAACGRTLSPIR
jgi:hypothetical protein